MTGADHLERRLDLLETDLGHSGIGTGFLGLAFGIGSPETDLEGPETGLEGLEIDLEGPETGIDCFGIGFGHLESDPGRLGMRLKLELA